MKFCYKYDFCVKILANVNKQCYNVIINNRPEDTKMNITETRIRLVTKDDSKLKAIATITIDGCMIVHDIKVVEGTDGLFIAMPSRKMPSGEYKDIVHPLNTETREALKNLIVDEYQKALSADQSEN